MTNPWLLRIFPFLGWFPVNSTVLRGDVIAGITGALVLVPKAMAYAQLAGLPVYFGLYTAFVPAILGALWGSSRQLATGPVAVVSLMTAAAVAPLAVPMSEEFVGMVLLLTLMVGVIQFSLGALSLGTIVNFVSHPVILGFMNAAAIIIALSQLDMLLGIPKGRSDFFLKDIWEMFGYLPMTHLPTLAMSVFALALMLGLKKIAPKPSVLIAVVITAIVSYAVAFEHNTKASIDQVMDPEVRGVIEQASMHETRATAIITEINAKQARIKQVEKERKRARADADRIIAARRYDTSTDAGTPLSTSEYDNTIAALHYEVELLQSSLRDVEDRSRNAVRTMRKFTLDLVPGGNGEPDKIYLKGRAPQDATTDGRSWHIKKIERGAMKLVGGGDVVGTIPTGLPSFRMPPLGLDTMMQLLSAALIIALVAFMESISMAKAMATKSKQRIDPNQELIGQGIANMGGAFFQSYPACGSFTGSAINLQAGAKTGFAMVFNGLFVAVTLLLLTPYLYHLPKAVLAVIILLAVTGLITPMALKHTWQASRLDGFVAAATFVLTLLAAPHLDKGILIGAALAIILYLYRTMAPRVAILGRFHDGTLRDVKVNPNLATSRHVVAMRFDGSLYFANIAHFEDAVLEAVANHKDAKYLLVVGDGINQLDASGEEVMHHLVERLRDAGVEIVFSGLKKQILDVMRSTGLFTLIGQQNIFPTENQALAAIYERLGSEAADDLLCPVPARWAKADSTAPTASRKVG